MSNKAYKLMQVLVYYMKKEKADITPIHIKEKCLN